MFLKFKPNDIEKENKQDGYSIISLNKNFQKKLKKNFNKKADKIYKQLYVSSKNKFSIIPSNYNPIEIKHQMEIEDALDCEGVVAMRIDIPLNDNSSIYNIENKFISREQRYMFCNTKEQQIILCPNNEASIESMKLIIQNEVISLREQNGKEIDYSDNYGIKEVSETEEEILKKEIEREIEFAEYLGNEQMAFRLLASNDPVVKIFLNKKYHKEIEAMLLMLNINYAIVNNTFVISKNKFKEIKQHVSGIINGVLQVKSDALYDIVNNQIIARSENSLELDEIIKENDTKEFTLNIKDKDFQPSL